MVLLALVVLSVVAVTSIQIAGQQKQAGGGSLQTTKAFYVAEAGLHEVIASWDSVRYDTMTALAGTGDSLDLGNRLIQENGQVYRAMIYHLGDSTTKQYRITSEEMSSGMGRRVAVTVAAEEQFEFVLFSLTGLEHTQSDIIGDVAANGNIGMGAAVTGNVYAGGTVSNHSLVSGIVKEGVPPRNFASVACPTSTPRFETDHDDHSYGLYGPLPIGQSVTLDPMSGDLTITGSTPTTFMEGTYFFHNVYVDGSGGLAVSAGAAVKIYVSGSLYIGGSGYVNRDGPAANFKLVGCGGVNAEWILTTSRESWLQVLAPDNALAFNNSGDNHGIFVAGKILKGGSGVVTYEAPDGGVQTPGGGAGSFRPISGTWVDISN